MFIALRRGMKDVLESSDRVLDKYEIIVEKEPEDEGKSIEELLGEKRRYKIGDGIHTYKELEYEKEKIPVVFVAFIGALNIAVSGTIAQWFAITAVSPTYL